MQSGPELKGRFYKFLVPRRRSGWITANPEVIPKLGYVRVGHNPTATHSHARIC